MPETKYIAIDMGAESGRVMLGTLTPRGRGAPPTLELEEWHRFHNTPIVMAGGLRWNIQQLWSEIVHGVGRAVKAAGGPGNVHGISADSWGVDYILIGKGSPMLNPPFIYRDPRNTAPFERAMKDVGKEFIFGHTGIQFMAINTLYQLLAEPRELLDFADGWLTIADYVNWLVAGCPRTLSCEVSMASTTQLLDVRTRQWSDPLIERVGLPRRIFPTVVESGTKLGKSELVPGAEVIAGCSHDTACAIAAVPVEVDAQWAYISSGTWSLAGMELKQPIVSDRSRDLGFTNELGASGTTRLLKNISGLYMLQQCRSAWKAAGQEMSYAQLASMGEKAAPLRSLIRPDSAPFGAPGDMPSRIVEYCKQTNQPAPQNVGQFVRCIYESLALLYRKTLSELRELTGQSIARLHIVGGGSRATLLNQLSADACGVPVIAGPVEATSMGNVLVQANALGHISALDIRRIVRESVSAQTFTPTDERAMQEAFERFLKLPVL